MIKTTPIKGDPITYAEDQLGPDGPGWVAIQSEVLGSLILFVRDDAAVIPHEVDRLPRYYLHELRALAKDPPGPKELRTVHEVRSFFNGRIVDPSKAEGPRPEKRPSEQRAAEPPPKEPEITPEEPESDQLAFL
jgi:hypothetical protein